MKLLEVHTTLGKGQLESGLHLLRLLNSRPPSVLSQPFTEGPKDGGVVAPGLANEAVPPKHRVASVVEIASERL